MTLNGLFFANDLLRLQNAETFLGGDVDIVGAHTGRASWTDWTGSIDWMILQVKSIDAPIRWSIPLFANGGTLAQGAAHAYDSYYVAAAKKLLAASGTQSEIMVRMGEEFNANWMPWAAAGKEADFIKTYQNFVDAFRSVSNKFKFEWNVNIGGTMDPAKAYPGDAYVDYIGMDFYWDSTQSWSIKDPTQAFNYFKNTAYGLQWFENFAAAHGKPSAYSEWGVNSTNGAAYIDLVKKWFDTHNVAYELYFDKGEWSITRGEQGTTSTAFQKDFSWADPISITPPPATSTAPAPAPSPSPTPAPTESPVGTATAPAASGTTSPTPPTSPEPAGSTSTPTTTSPTSAPSPSSNTSTTTTAPPGDTATPPADAATAPTPAADPVVSPPVSTPTTTEPSHTETAAAPVITAGDDRITGGDGNDFLNGLAGNDTIDGGKGDDMITGGAGADRFLFAPGSGKDRITDFAANGDADVIDISGYLKAGQKPTLTNVGKDVSISFANGDSIVLTNIQSESLVATDTGYKMGLRFFSESGSDQANHSAPMWGHTWNKLETAGDKDWFKIDLSKGWAMKIALEAAGSGMGTLENAKISIFDDSGKLIASDDDSGSGSDALARFTVPATGTYYVVVESAKAGGIGSYMLDATYYNMVFDQGTHELVGSSNYDVLVGSRFDDSFTGGKGVDRFQIGVGNGHDVVTDFSDKGDLIDIMAYKQAGYKATVTQSGSDTVIGFSTGDSITLLGVSPDQLNENYWGFTHK